jgi:hypothetical protein
MTLAAELLISLFSNLGMVFLIVKSNQTATPIWEEMILMTELLTGLLKNSIKKKVIDLRKDPMALQRTERSI